MLRVKGLVARYRPGCAKGIDFEVPDGQVMAPSPVRAGKSTVIRCINRLVEPTAGSVTLNDTEITARAANPARRMGDLPGICAGRATR